MARNRNTLGVALIALWLVACGGAQKRTTASDLPIKKVVLYQNGVGYFERSGKLDGNVLTLQARPSQINDLLKSLTVIDRGKGRAVSVALPLEKSQALRLSELPPQVRGASGLLDVLRVFRGAKVRVSGSSGTVDGRVVGVEDLSAGKAEEKADWRLTLKTDDGSLKIYPVADVKEIALRDRTLAVGLDQSLDVSLGAQNWKPVELKIRLTGAESHDIVASYIVEMPRWKPAYRLVLGAEGKPLLQGWAVVDNVSGEDWNDVRLSLVAGTPMSFIYDLHSPQFTRRVDLSPRGRTTALAPTVEQSGYASNAEKERVERDYAKKKRKADRGPMRSRRSAPAPKAAPRDDAPYGGEDYDEAEEAEPMTELDSTLERQAGPSAAGAQVGALFRYDLADKVTVSDRSSTLVAIVNKRVPGKEIVLFRPELTRGSVASYPYRAVMFTNDSGYALEKGPVAIYSQGTFVGEGFLTRLEKSASSFITFSVDANVSMETEQQRKNEGLRLLKVVSGLLVSEVLDIQRSVYTVKNRHPREVVAYVKSRKWQGWKLRNAPKQGVVDAGKFVYVPVTVKAGGEAELVIEWVKPVERRVAIDSSMAKTVLKGYLASGNVPPGLRAQIDKILALKSELDDAGEEEARLRKQHNTLSADQKRIRMNLNLLRKTKGNKVLMNELVKKLAKIERDLGKLSGRMVRLSERQAAIRRQLKVLIRTITITGK
ncbi:MAG: DUF4139 domain-containing protein [Deltaproteobacteria bacterium]|nr:DUF4139 domain-containing protein [Deltaproteobacteria bacterium]